MSHHYIDQPRDGDGRWVGNSTLAFVPKLNKVDSTALEGRGYNDKRSELRVRYKGGKKVDYLYEGVQSETNQSFIEAESQGRFVNKHIKGDHPFLKSTGFGRLRFYRNGRSS